MRLVLDLGPTRVSGAIKANRARTIYNADDGRLYVATTPTRVTAHETSEPVAYQPGRYLAETPDGLTVELTQAGCRCGGYPLGKIPPETLMALADA